MPIHVIPRWIKVLVLILSVAVGWYLWNGAGKPKTMKSRVHLVGPAPSPERGLSGKAQANIRQFVINPLEPTRLPEQETVIFRDGTSNYYKDEPGASQRSGQ